jgi:hypothetical protein
MQFLINEIDNILYSRLATVTINTFTKYEKMIINTISDFEKHFYEIDNKLQTLSL